MTARLLVAHLIRPQPAGSVGGADLHVADLAVAQLRAGDVEPLVVELGDTGFAERVRARGVSAVSFEGAFRPGMLRRVAAAVSEADVVHGHGYESDYVAALLSMARRRQVMVATSHGFVRYSPVMAAKTRLNEWALRAADAVIAVGRPEGARLRKMLGVKVHDVSNGVFGPARPKPWAALGDSPRLGYVGRLSPEKRPDLALDVLTAIAARRPGTSLSVFGAGPEEAALRGQADRLGMAARVCFKGVVHDVDRIYDAIDVLLCLSDAEGTPRVVLEAMARGVPVVATAVGGVPDLLRADGGVLVRPGQAEEAAAALDALLDDAVRVDEVRRAGRAAWERHFTAEAMERRVLAVYDQAGPSPRRYEARRYWEDVGDRLSDAFTSQPIAGDDTPYYREKRQEVADRVRAVLARGGTWLEIGCGPGRNLELAAGTPALVVGADFALPMLRLAAEAGVDAPLVGASGDALPFADGAFDNALLVTVLQHTPAVEARRVVREVCRVASTVHVVEDVAVVHVPDRASHTLRPIAAYAAMFAACGFALTGADGMQRPVSEASAVALRRLLNASGRGEGERVSAAHERWESRLLPLTRALDRLAPSAVGLAWMTFARDPASGPDA